MLDFDGEIDIDSNADVKCEPDLNCAQSWAKENAFVKI